MPLTESMRHAVDRIFLGCDNDTAFHIVGAASSGKRPEIQAVVYAFRRNVDGATATASVPFEMAHASVHRRHSGLVYAAERIRALKEVEAGQPLTPALERAALDRARADEVAWAETDEGRDWFARAVLAELAGYLEVPRFAASAQELIRQAAVLCWGAFEILVRDLHVVSFGTPAAGVKAAIKALLSGGDPVAFLRQRSLWGLYQRRHLIVHRLGVVDAEYLRHTGEQLPVGVVLNVTPKDLVRYVEASAEAAAALVAMTG